MIKNYLKTAYRSLLKNKFYSAINIVGLSVGLATGIMLLLWVQNELGYDKFHKDYQNIYQLSSHFNSNGADLTWNGVPGPLTIMSKSIPTVQSIVRTQKEFDQVLSDKNKIKVFDGNIISYVDSAFFSIFSFQLLEGNRTSVFPNNNSVVLTETTSNKLFGTSKSIGKILQFHKKLFTVTGILRDFPENSSIRYDAVFPMSYFGQEFTERGGNGDWKTIDQDLGDFNFTTYVKLQPDAQPINVGKSLTVAYKKARKGDSEFHFKLQPLSEIHLIASDGNNASLRMVQIFLLVVVLLLAIASINYVNLSTARTLIRAKEVSIRKIVGAKKHQLFIQFTLETVLLFCSAIILGSCLIAFLMPLYNLISGKQLSINLRDFQVWKSAGAAIVCTLIASSIYPAFLLSSFKPIESLKGKIKSGIGVATFRKGLVIFQFSISVILLICTITISTQMTYIRNKDLGFDKSYVFTVPLTQEVVNHVESIKTELKKSPGVLNVAASDAYNLSSVSNSTGDLDWKNKPVNTNLMITFLSADHDFIPTIGLKFVEGGNFLGTPADSSHYILNETAVKSMGLSKPYVGQQISLHSNKGTIIGVLKDFNFQSLKEKISPIIFFSRWDKNILYVRTNATHVKQTISAVENLYKRYAGEVPFKYNFLDHDFAEQYQADERAGVLFNVFSGIAIFISCLGLFGLVTYTAQVKNKEIGLRKVLGASVTAIVQLLSKDFLKLVLIALLVAFPLGWYAMNSWLENFAYHITIQWWMFALAGLTAILIAFITISFQAIKAALANPIKSLRTE